VPILLPLQAVYLEFASALVPAAARLPTAFSVLQLTLNFINKLVELLSAVCRLARASEVLELWRLRSSWVLDFGIGHTQPGSQLLDSISL